MYLHTLKIENFRKFHRQQKILFANDLEIDQKDVTEATEKNEEKKFNIASDLTLIIGKNNSGKTTVINALNKLLGKEQFNEQDFNFVYLAELLEFYKDKNYDLLPKIRFKLLIGSEDSESDNLTNIYPFIQEENYSQDKNIDSIYTVNTVYEPREEENLRRELANNIKPDSNLSDLLEIIGNSKYGINYYREDNQIVSDFNIKRLIEMQFIEANQLKEDDILSKSFSKIFDSNLKNNASEETTNNISNNINNFNSIITQIANENIAKDTRKSLEGMIHSSNMSMNLSGNLESKDLFSRAIKYSYSENGYVIPENQYGLGYTNLVTIIAKIIEYIELYKEKAFQSKVNLLAIEEPETFMHPQMQELFIKNINNVVNTVLESLSKDVQLQLIVTTHSSHLVNSKLKSSQSLDYINYLTNSINGLISVPLNNENIIPLKVREKYKRKENKIKNELRFLMTHLTYKTSELLFADAVIFVEGPTEENTIRYYIDKVLKYEKLRKHYITIFNIDGAHAHRYAELIKTIQIPCVIITDLDITRKENDNNITFDNLEDVGRTTNNTLKYYLSKENPTEYPLISNICSIETNHVFRENNLGVYTQHKEIEGYLATSFEEAIILTNYNKKILNDALKNTRPVIYKEIVGEPEDIELNKHKSYHWQKKLSEMKTMFSNNLLFELIQNEIESAEEPERLDLPDYIDHALKFLDEKLNRNISQEGTD